MLYVTKLVERSNMNKIKYYFSVAFISLFKYLYNNCKLFKRFIQNRARKQGEMNLFLLEFFMTKEPIDVDYWCNRLSKINNDYGKYIEKN